MGCRAEEALRPTGHESPSRQQPAGEDVSHGIQAGLEQRGDGDGGSGSCGTARTEGPTSWARLRQHYDYATGAASLALRHGRRAGRAPVGLGAAVLLLLARAR